MGIQRNIFKNDHKKKTGMIAPSCIIFDNEASWRYNRT